MKLKVGGALSLVSALIVVWLASVGGSLPTSWPDATNTGYTHAPGYPGSLTTAAPGDPDCPTTIESNQTYSFCDYPLGADVGSVSDPVENVTFIGARFKATSVGGALVKLYGDNITFQYSSFEPGNAAPPTAYEDSYQYGLVFGGSFNTFAQQLTVEHSDFWGFGNAIDGCGSTEAKPHVFRDNWIHDAAEDGGGIYHTDGIGCTSGGGRGSHVVIDHNTIESVGNTNGIAYQEGSYSDFTITNNLFGGFGFTVAVWAPAPRTVFTNNTFSTQLPITFGPLYPQAFWTGEGSLWRCNRWEVPSGAAWGNPAHDGWFWIPDTASSGTATDDPWVSETDPAAGPACPS